MTTVAYSLVKSKNFVEIWEKPSTPKVYIVQLKEGGRVLECTHDIEDACEVMDEFERCMVG